MTSGDREYDIEAFDWEGTEGRPGDEPSDRDDGGNRFRETAALALPAVVAIVVIMFIFTGGATANADFMAEDVEVTAHNGAPEAVTLAPEGELSYQGMEQEPEEVQLTVEVKLAADDEWETVTEESREVSGLSGTMSYAFDENDIIQATSIQKADFRAENGQTEHTDVDVRLTATFVGGGTGGEDVVAVGADAYTVTTHNVQSGGNVGGNANTGAV